MTDLAALLSQGGRLRAEQAARTPSLRELLLGRDVGSEKAQQGHGGRLGQGLQGWDAARQDERRPSHVTFCWVSVTFWAASRFKWDYGGIRKRLA